MTRFVYNNADSMTTRPKISVVIPAYNEESYLPACLASIRQQTFTDYELIVVDNNSTDKTADIARSMGARVVRETVQGMTPARERGFAEARAPLIARTDADATVSPDWLKRIYDCFHQHPEAVALTGSFRSPDPHISNVFFIAYVYAYILLTRLLTGHMNLHGPNMAIRKEAWERIRVHTDDALVHEDVDLACHMAEIGKILFIPDLTVTYSLRRLKKRLWYTLAEYFVRYIRTIRLHSRRQRQTGAVS